MQHKSLVLDQMRVLKFVGLAGKQNARERESYHILVLSLVPLHNPCNLKVLSWRLEGHESSRRLTQSTKHVLTEGLQ